MSKKKTATANAAPAREVKRERITVNPDTLHDAPWNPRGKIPADSVADLVASIRSVGLISPISVMAAESGYTIIAGHRRAAACRIAGMTEVPADLLDVTEAEARRMCFVENLQRRDADPLLEADLVQSLMADGMTFDEIAAETGKPRAWVIRRHQIVHLDPVWRKAAGKRDFTTDALEKIARYHTETQTQAFKKFEDSWIGTQKGTVKWGDVDMFFRSYNDLERVPFDTAECKSCLCNTAATPDLFDYNCDGELGTCTRCNCYRRKWAEAAAAKIAAAEKDGLKVLRYAHTWDTPNTHTERKRTDKVIVVAKRHDDLEEISYLARMPKDGGGNAVTGNGGLTEAEKEERKRSRERNAARRRFAKDVWDKLPPVLERYLVSKGGNLVWGRVIALHAAFDMKPWHIPGIASHLPDLALYSLADNAVEMKPEDARGLAAEFAQTISRMIEKSDADARKLLVILPAMTAAAMMVSPVEEVPLAEADRELIADGKPIAAPVVKVTEERD